MGLMLFTHTHTHTHTQIHTHNHFTAVLDFARDYPGEPGCSRSRAARFRAAHFRATQFRAELLLLLLQTTNLGCRKQ